MALKTKDFVVGPDGGRDAGKVFVIRETPARILEKMAARAILALAENGAPIPDLAGGGMAALVGYSFQALMSGIPWHQAEPLMDEIMTYVAVRPDPANPSVVRALIDRGADGDDIEEVSTRIDIRAEWFTLNTGFSLADVK